MTSQIILNLGPLFYLVGARRIDRLSLEEHESTLLIDERHHDKIASVSDDTRYA